MDMRERIHSPRHPPLSPLILRGEDKKKSLIYTYVSSAARKSEGMSIERCVFRSVQT